MYKDRIESSLIGVRSREDNKGTLQHENIPGHYITKTQRWQKEIQQQFQRSQPMTDVATLITSVYEHPDTQIPPFTTDSQNYFGKIATLLYQILTIDSPVEKRSYSFGGGPARQQREKTYRSRRGTTTTNYLEAFQCIHDFWSELPEPCNEKGSLQTLKEQLITIIYRRQRQKIAPEKWDNFDDKVFPYIRDVLGSNAEIILE